VTSDEMLVNGVLLPGFTGTGVPGWLARAADEGLAGACLFAGNVGPGLPALTAALHEHRAGFLVASDEEGGSVTRLDGPWPGAAALGRLDDEAVTAAVAAAIGARCRDAGIDLALAPVADVNAEPDNPVIGIRSFGACPELVSRHTAAFVRGMQGAGTAATAKHFPGHGCTTTDSHLALPVVDDDATTVRARDLPPFAAAVAAGVRCVLTAHVRFPAFDERPATMSPPLLALLRRELGFDGVVISDAVDMAAVAATVGMGPGAIAAVAAGVDLVCTGNPQNGYDDETAYRAVRDALLAALADGTLPRERLAEAGHRVAQLAAWVAAAPTGRGGVDGAQVVRRVSEVRGDVRVGPGAHVVDLRNARNIADGRSGEPRVAEALRRRDPAVTAGAGTPAGRPLVVVVRGPSPAFDDLRAARPDAVAVHVGLPGAWRPAAPSVTLWGDGRVHAEVAAQLLAGIDWPDQGFRLVFPGGPQGRLRIRAHRRRYERRAEGARPGRERRDR
jgi:beta-N-acetylhexosaminidase